MILPVACIFFPPEVPQSLSYLPGGFSTHGFEFAGKDARYNIVVSHRPKDVQVSQLYRIPSNANSTELERLTYFNIDSGRIIRSFLPLLGEDWRGAWRARGALMVMDLSGNENFQLWWAQNSRTLNFCSQTDMCVQALLGRCG